MKLSKPGPAIVIPNQLRERLAKLSPEAREVALKLIRAKIRRVRKAGPPPNLVARNTPLVPPKTGPREACRVLPFIATTPSKEK